MKTNGQILYEHNAPAYIRVVRASDVASASSADVFLTPNPVHQVPWRLLTDACQESWEKTAVGHNLCSEELI